MVGPPSLGIADSLGGQGLQVRNHVFDLACAVDRSAPILGRDPVAPVPCVVGGHHRIGIEPLRVDQAEPQLSCRIAACDAMQRGADISRIRLSLDGIAWQMRQVALSGSRTRRSPRAGSPVRPVSESRIAWFSTRYRTGSSPAVAEKQRPRSATLHRATSGRSGFRKRFVGPNEPPGSVSGLLALPMDVFCPAEQERFAGLREQAGSVSGMPASPLDAFRRAERKRTSYQTARLAATYPAMSSHGGRSVKCQRMYFRRSTMSGSGIAAPNSGMERCRAPRGGRMPSKMI